MARSCDALIIGSGIAALSYAIEASERGRRVVIVTKKTAREANTSFAQGGIASVLEPDDSHEAHVEDTLKAGAGLCRKSIVEGVVADGPAAVRRMIELGVSFDPAEAESGVAYDLGREGGHSFRRVYHAGDITGEEIMRGLLVALEARENVEILEHHTAVDLLTTKKLDKKTDDNHCLGAYVLEEKTGEVHTFRAPVTVLATGGASKVYLYTSNPDVATGDGVAMAWRVGADIANMEFIQFHPTCLYHPRAKSFLISEALRGEGGVLRRRDGSRFMETYDPQKELAPRDIVARAIDTELKRTGDDFVGLDMTHLDPKFIARRFPNIHETCLTFGVDMTKEPIPVVPAAHYVCGGVKCDESGETSIPGLFVVGEVACTGLHGANRLASNSLLEGAVFGHRAAIAAERYYGISNPNDDAPDWDAGNAVPSDELVVISQCWDEIRRFMWNYVGIVRSDRRLLRAQRRITTLEEEIREFYWNATVTRDLVELRNLCVVADLIVRCALKRKESRGLHYSIDYPTLAKNDQPRDTIIRREELI